MTTQQGRPAPPSNPHAQPMVLLWDGANNRWAWISPQQAATLQGQGGSSFEFHGVQPPAASLERLRGAFSTGAGPVGSSFSGSNADEGTLFGLGNSYRDAQTNLRNNQRWAQTWAAQGPQYNEQRSATGANNPFWKTAQEYQQRIADLERQRDSLFAKNFPQEGGGLAAGPSNQMLVSPEGGLVPQRPGDPQTGPTGGLTVDQILEAYRRGGSRADTVSALLDLRMSADEVYDLLGSIDRGGTLQGGPGAAPTPTSGGPPTVRPEPAAAPGTFKQRLQQQLSGSDFFRRYAMQSGVAPMFQDFASQLAQRQEFPFALSQAQQGDVLNADPQASFSAFLERQGFGGGASVGQNLRSAGDFLRSPNASFGSQEALLPWLVDREGTGGAPNIGSALFRPTIERLTEGPILNFAPGLGRTGPSAVRNSLQNYLAQNPTEFEDAPGFIDFLTRQGLLR